MTNNNKKENPGKDSIIEIEQDAESKSKSETETETG
eukprot:CAMPEP_0116936772 /NCGR_PEP_ID=MMETSP0467-20121206/31091_1 /TAXON_ID=283647 /ORGANISM="Mesodinium pulex, Strain SPMC105" /LENGTH=35 /DNA_ID= /DNA_START= /DNA_END= /DNA_ORIENTATION=